MASIISAPPDQRRKPAGDPRPEIAERHETLGNAHRGEIVPCYPAVSPRMLEYERDLALAQVTERSNPGSGISQSTAAIARHSNGAARVSSGIGGGIAR